MLIQSWCPLASVWDFSRETTRDCLSLGVSTICDVCMLDVSDETTISRYAPSSSFYPSGAMVEFSEEAMSWKRSIKVVIDEPNFTQSVIMTVEQESICFEQLFSSPHPFIKSFMYLISLSKHVSSRTCSSLIDVDISTLNVWKSKFSRYRVTDGVYVDQPDRLLQNVLEQGQFVIVCIQMSYSCVGMYFYEF